MTVKAVRIWVGLIKFRALRDVTKIMNPCMAKSMHFGFGIAKHRIIGVARKTSRVSVDEPFLKMHCRQRKRIIDK